MSNIWSDGRWILASVALCCVACGGREASEVPVRVESVAFDQTAQAPVIFLHEDKGERRLPIWIGLAEAQAIAMRLQGINPPRPQTHDLLKAVLDQTGAEVRKVVVTELRDGVYYARIHLVVGRGVVEVDSRPSDAIALALRSGSPIFVAPPVFEASKGSSPPAGSGPDLRARGNGTEGTLGPVVASDSWQPQPRGRRALGPSTVGAATHIVSYTLGTGRRMGARSPWSEFLLQLRLGLGLRT